MADVYRVMGSEDNYYLEVVADVPAGDHRDIVLNEEVHLVTTVQQCDQGHDFLLSITKGPSQIHPAKVMRIACEIHNESH